MKDKTNQRKNLIKTYLTNDEYKQFMDDLELFGMSTSKYIRWSLFNRSITFRCKRFELNDELYTTIRELKRIGTNVNQIAVKLNSEDTEIPVSELREIISEIHRTNIKIVELYSHIEDDMQEYIWTVE